MVSAGTLIYSGFVPLMKMGLTILLGFWITKKGLFPTVAARGASHIAMSIALPCLVFSSIVPSFNSSNIASLGPLCLNAILYQLLGALMGIIIRETFYVPADFYHGIVLACTFSNWGNLPTAVVQTIAFQDPFNGAADETLGVAYVSVFILIYNISFFGIGTCKICAWDFKENSDGDDISRENIRDRWRRRFRWIQARLAGSGKVSSRLSLGVSHHQDSKEGVENADTALSLENEKGLDTPLNQPQVPPLYTGGTAATLAPTLSRYRSHQEAITSAQTYHDTISLAPVSSRASRAASVNRRPSKYAREPSSDKAFAHHPEEEEDETHHKDEVHRLGRTIDNGATAQSGDVDPSSASRAMAVESATDPSPTAPEKEARNSNIGKAIFSTLKTLMTPATMSVLISLPVSLINPLKALFTSVDGWTGTKMPNAPDGHPPLSFIMDTTVFVGAMTVPLGLLLLGASFARLKIPRPFSKLPIAAIVAVTVAKMVLLPFFGVGFTLGLRSTTSLYPESNKMLNFVAMLLSGTPSAVNQLVITQIYSPDGTANTLAAFLALQYIFMFFANAALAAVALKMVA